MIVAFMLSLCKHGIKMNHKKEREFVSKLNPTAIRMPSSLKEKLRAAAEENENSLNAEIVKRLENSLNISSIDGSKLTAHQLDQLLKQVTELVAYNKQVIDEMISRPNNKANNPQEKQ